MTEALLEHGRALEVRVSGRTLRAEMPYGSRARDRGEMFAPGSIEPIYPVTLNVQHDPMLEVATTADRSLRLRDTPHAMIVEADLRGDAASGPLGLVTRRALRAISPEFYARRARTDAGLRIIERAGLPAFGLVDVGSYATPLELRAGQLLTATIPTGHRCSCECARDCNYVELAHGSLDALIDGDTDVVATTGRLTAENILGSREAGTLLIERSPMGATVTLTNADTPAAASVRAAAAVSPIHVRPVIGDDSVTTKAGDVLKISRLVTGVLLVKTAPPDRREGLEPAVVADPDAEARAAHRRRLWL